MKFFGIVVFLGGLFLVGLGYFGRVYIHLSVDSILKIMGVVGAIAGLVIIFGNSSSGGRRY